MSTEARLKRLGMPPGLGPEESRRWIEEESRKARAALESPRPSPPQAAPAPLPAPTK